MSGRRARAALGLLVAVLLLAGCGGLSHDGPVEPGLEVGSGNAPVLRALPARARRRGSTQDQHRARLRAGRRRPATPRYDNAKAFLTTQMSERWKPDRTLVLLADDVAPKATLLDPATVRITADAAGTVDPSRALHRGPSRAARSAPPSASDRGRRVAHQRAARGVRPVDRPLAGVPPRAALRRALRLDQPARAWCPTPGGSRSTSSRPGWPGPSSRPCRRTSRAPPSPPCRPAPGCSGRPCRSRTASPRSTSSRGS